MQLNRILPLALVGLAATSCNAPEPDPRGETFRRSVKQHRGATSSTPSTPADIGKAFVYHDGDRERKVWRNDHVVAEIAPNATSKRWLLASFPGSVEIETPFKARIWRAPAKAGDDAIAALNATARRAVAVDGTPSSYSPVFHTGPSPKNSSRYLPGGAIVALDDTWSEAAVQRWANGAGVTIESRLIADRNVYVVTTDPGMPSLETANRLHASGRGVQWAKPRWAKLKLPR